MNKIFFHHMWVLLILASACASGAKTAEGTIAVSTSASTTSPKLKALVTIVFIDGAAQGEYLASVKIEEGSLKQGSKIDAVDETGKRFSFTVQEIKVNDAKVAEAKIGDSAFLVLQTGKGKVDGFDQGFYLVAPGGVIEGAVTVAATSSKAPETAENSSAGKNAVASFEVNGKPANTAPVTNDTDLPLGMINAQNDFLTLNFYGDEPGIPKRGFLTISCEKFVKQAGEVKNATFAFSRYQTANGGGEVMYGTEKGIHGRLNLTKFERTSGNQVGETYLVSGTFSAEMPVRSYYTKEAKTPKITVTNGKFENVLFQVLGKK